jgi:hypothetical protein
MVAVLFRYDFTLDEGGVEVHEDSNHQQFFNNHAKIAIAALSRLGGYKGLLISFQSALAYSILFFLPSCGQMPAKWVDSWRA